MLLMMRSSIMCRGGLSEEQKQTLTHCRLKHREQDTRDYGEKGKQKTKKREGVRQHLGGTNREHTAEGTKGMGIRGGGGTDSDTRHLPAMGKRKQDKAGSE